MKFFLYVVLVSLLIMNTVSTFICTEATKLKKNDMEISSKDVMEYMRISNVPRNPSPWFAHHIRSFTVFNNLKAYEDLPENVKDSILGDNILLVEPSILDGDSLFMNINQNYISHLLYDNELFEINSMSPDNKYDRIRKVTFMYNFDGVEREKTLYLISLKHLNSFRTMHFSKSNINYPDYLLQNNVITLIGFA